MKRVILAAMTCAAFACASPRAIDTGLVSCGAWETVIVDHTYRVRSIHGVVLATMDGQPLEGAKVIVRGLGTAAEVGRAVTNERGEFELAGVPAGWYQMETCLDGFNAMVMKIRVTPVAANRPIRVYVALDA
ncbi:MAG: carboxypeptidase-like regulatory domain-containing protein [Thermoanaerobaculia bacterium]